MKERVFAAVREMKREQWLICGLAGLLLLVIAAPVKQKEQKKTQEKTTVSQTQEQTDDQIRQSYEKQLESVLSQVEGVGAVQVAVAMESTGKKQVEKDSPEDTSTSSEKEDSGTQRSSQTVTTGETTVYEDTGDGGQTSIKPLKYASKRVISQDTLFRSFSSSAAVLAPKRIASPKSWAANPGITVSRSMTQMALPLALSNSTLFNLVSLCVTRSGISPAASRSPK